MNYHLHPSNIKNILFEENIENEFLIAIKYKKRYIPPETLQKMRKGQREEKNILHQFIEEIKIIKDEEAHYENQTLILKNINGNVKNKIKNPKYWWTSGKIDGLLVNGYYCYVIEIKLTHSLTIEDAEVWYYGQIQTYLLLTNCFGCILVLKNCLKSELKYKIIHKDHLFCNELIKRCVWFYNQVINKKLDLETIQGDFKKEFNINNYWVKLKKIEEKRQK